jgi:hypothetical protein
MLPRLIVDATSPVMVRWHLPPVKSRSLEISMTEAISAVRVLVLHGPEVPTNFDGGHHLPMLSTKRIPAGAVGRAKPQPTFYAVPGDAAGHG